MSRVNYETVKPDAAFFINCAFISVDLQEPRPGTVIKANLTKGEIPQQWLEKGFTVGDVNRANRFLREKCEPNAARVTEALRGVQPEIPMIYVHWQARYEDMIDIDPMARWNLLSDYSEGARIGFVGGIRSGRLCPVKEKPLAGLKARDSDYILGKPAQDSFIATPLEFMLRNLKIANLILIGGHTGACLGKTSITAKKLGFSTLCVADATFNAFESNRIEKIQECGYDYIINTDSLLDVLNRRPGLA